MTKRIVFFDFDGVIVDTFSFCFRIVEGREYITEAEYKQRFEGNVFDAVRKFKNPDTKVEDFRHQYTPELMKCEPIKEISEAIRELAMKFTLIIVSSTETDPISDYLKMVGLRQYFTEILGADVDRSKVNKITRVLNEYKIVPNEAVFITDTLGDMREAEKCNVRCIAVSGGYHDTETLKKGNPFAIVNSGSELPKTVDSYFTSLE